MTHSRNSLYFFSKEISPKSENFILLSKNIFFYLCCNQKKQIMPAQNESFAKASENRANRPQILTTDDLREFKVEMLEEIKKLLWQNGIQPVKKWLKSPDVRKLLHISPGTLQNLRVNGSLPFTKIGGIIYYDSDDIQKMLNNNKIQHN